MRIARNSKPKLRIAVVESDPLRLVGFHALLESESDLEIIATSLAEITIQENIDVVLIGDRPSQNLVDTISDLKVMHPNLPVIVIGPNRDDETSLNTIAHGAKGYVFDGASPSEFAGAIRVVSQGLRNSTSRRRFWISLNSSQTIRCNFPNTSEATKKSFHFRTTSFIRIAFRS